MRLNLSRLLIGLVLLMNLQAALLYLISPGSYGPGFELSGAVGEAVIRSLGVLFLMWNVPYVVALWHPVRYRVALYMAIAMQAIGVVGESWIYLLMPALHATARGSILRFIIFDTLGLLALVSAAWINRRVMVNKDQA
jgi:hypothetical protein